MTTATLTEVEVCLKCGEPGDAEGYCGCFAPSDKPLEWTRWTETEATYEDPMQAIVRTCGDCQHFRYQASISNGKGAGYCSGKSVVMGTIHDLMDITLEYPAKVAGQKACTDILPIGWCDAF